MSCFHGAVDVPAQAASRFEIEIAHRLGTTPLLKATEPLVISRKTVSIQKKELVASEASNKMKIRGFAASEDFLGAHPLTSLRDSFSLQVTNRSHNGTICGSPPSRECA
jgi:hypothetical protein